MHSHNPRYFHSHDWVSDWVSSLCDDCVWCLSSLTEWGLSFMAVLDDWVSWLLLTEFHDCVIWCPRERPLSLLTVFDEWVSWLCFITCDDWAHDYVIWYPRERSLSLLTVLDEWVSWLCSMTEFHDCARCRVPRWLSFMTVLDETALDDCVRRLRAMIVLDDCTWWLVCDDATVDDWLSWALDDCAQWQSFVTALDDWASFAWVSWLRGDCVSWQC